MSDTPLPTDEKLYGDEMENLEHKAREMQHAIDEFCRGQEWAADIWKRQPHIARLFELRTSDGPAPCADHEGKK